MYDRVQKSSSSWNPSPAQKKKSSKYGPRTFTVQPRRETKSSQTPVPKYSVDATNKRFVTLVGSIEVPARRQADALKLQPKSEQEAAPVEEVATVSQQAPEVEIQRQCLQRQEEEEESWWDRGIDWVENKVASGAHQLADKANGIPVLEQVADAGAWMVDQQTQLTGGILKGAGTMVGGIANMIVHPVDTVMGLEAMAEHVPMLPGVPNPLKAAHGLYDIAVNGKDASEVANHVLNPIQSLQDDFEFGKKIVGGITKPYQQEIDQGKYAEAIGRGIFDIGSLVLGAGAGAGVKGAAGAGRGAAIAGEVADAARIAEGAAFASDAAKATEGAAFASDAARASAGMSEAHNAAQFAKLKAALGTTEKAEAAIASLRETGQLPSEYVTKAQAEAAGWKPGKALGNSLPGKQIGGDIFENRPPAPGAKPLLPDAPGRTWYEADVGIDSSMKRSKQPGTRLLYSSDGEIYVTTDHYETAHPVGRWK